jgi:pimeloyl-ACP methyl ester carboxylesterase
MLELIDKGSCSDAHPTPLLFVHGAWHAAWCWDENLPDFFADKGFRAVAVSLRGPAADDMRLSVSLCSEDIAVLDACVKRTGLPSRSAGFQRAVHMLRYPTLEKVKGRPGSRPRQRGE